MAEDDADDAFLIGHILEKMSAPYVYKRFRDGQELLDYLGSSEATVYDIGVVLLDVNMPRKGGLETLAAIRENPDLAALPVAGYSTGGGGAELSRRFLDMGGDWFFTKPDSFDELSASLANLLQNIST